MKKLYLTKREDFFNAMAKNLIPEDCIKEFGSIWMELALTEKEFEDYSKHFAISLAY